MPAKRTKAEIEAEYRAAMAEAADDDDESDEVRIDFPDGHSFSGSFRRAKEVAAAAGFKLRPDPEPEPEDKPEGGTVRNARFGGGGAAGQRRSS